MSNLAHWTTGDFCGRTRSKLICCDFFLFQNKAKDSLLVPSRSKKGRSKAIYFWSTDDVLKWLRKYCIQYFQLYGSVFKQHDITGTVLLSSFCGLTRLVLSCNSHSKNQTCFLFDIPGRCLLRLTDSKLQKMNIVDTQHR